MKSRLAAWYDEKVSKMTEKELAAGIQNGDINCPKWLAYSPSSAIGFAIWDNEVSDGTNHLINIDIN